MDPWLHLEAQVHPYLTTQGLYVLAISVIRCTQTEVYSRLGLMMNAP